MGNTAHLCLKAQLMKKKNDSFAHNYFLKASTILLPYQSLSSRDGLVVERLLLKKCHSAMVDQILLGAMIIILNKKEL